MGGYGSGRRCGRDKVESCRSLDVNDLNRAGCLSPGWHGGWEWRRDGERTAWISLRSEADRLCLSYRVRALGEEWQDVTQIIPLDWPSCPFGGSRPFFLCPGQKLVQGCNRRVLKLYGADRYFLCRHCYGLTYASRNEDELDRAIRRSDKLKMRLGGEPGMVSEIPGKPKGMRWHTYWRLYEQASAAERIAEQHFLRGAEKILGRSITPD